MFPEIAASYLGAMSPIVRPFAGQIIPCGARGPHGPGRVCDAHGHELGLATLPFDGQTVCHDGCGQAIFHMWQEAKLHFIAEPRTIFASLIPPRVLLDRDHTNIIPDAAVDMSLPPAVSARHQRQGQPEPHRRHLVDFKTIYAGGCVYREPRARDDQSGAVALRAHRVHPDYRAKAGGLDNQFYAAPLTPVLDRLNQYGKVRALVFGNYGEASPDVHHCITAAARQRAEQTWRRYGARSEDEAYGFWLQRFRRDIGMAAVREFARYRVLRVPLIGVPREIVRSRNQGRREARAVPLDGAMQADFFAHQAALWQRA